MGSTNAGKTDAARRRINRRLPLSGAGDAFFAGATIGLTYGKTLAESCEIGTRLSASVICTSENVCPRFLPSEFGLEPGRAAGEQLTFDI